MLPAPSVSSSCHLRPRRYISSASTHAYPHDMTPATRRMAEAILSSEHDVPSLHDGRTSRRLALSKAITLIESHAEMHMRQADLLLNFLLRHSAIGDDNEKRPSTNSDNAAKDGSSSFRVGIAGPPGAGKSSFIEKFGLYVLNNKSTRDESSDTRDNDGQSSDQNPGTGDTNEDDNEEYSPSKLAVVCVDPSSSLTGGSILGDKTRMTELSRHDRAFVRPSPNRGTLGGLAAYTNDAITLCQAASYDLILVETVGLGQSEIEICEGVDMLLLLVPPGGGDSLQGVKKGIVELASMLVVNKADGNLLPAARTTAADYEAAIRFFRHRDDGWDIPPVLLASAKTGEGMERIWDEIVRYRQIMMANGELQKKRQKQNLHWMHKTLRELIIARAKSDPVLREMSEQLETDLMKGLVTPRAAAKELVDSITKASTN